MAVRTMLKWVSQKQVGMVWTAVIVFRTEQWWGWVSGWGSVMNTVLSLSYTKVMGRLLSIWAIFNCSRDVLHHEFNKFYWYIDIFVNCNWVNTRWQGNGMGTACCVWIGNCYFCPPTSTQEHAHVLTTRELAAQPQVIFMLKCVFEYECVIEYGLCGAPS